MKVVCIRDTWDSGKKVIGLTLGKTYDVINQLDTLILEDDAFKKSGDKLSAFKITQDDGNAHWYSSPERFFLSLNEYRFRQLDKLDI